MAKAPSKAPRVSINKLCEFMTAKAARQRQILRDQKYPTDFKGVYYKEATEAIAVSVACNLDNLKPVENAIKVLGQLTPDKIGTQRRIAANLDALETFLLMLDAVDLKGANTRLGDQSPPRLTIHGVEISVRPEVVLTATGKSNAPLVGALKLHFPRTFGDRAHQLMTLGAPGGRGVRGGDQGEGHNPGEKPLHRTLLGPRAADVSDVDGKSPDAPARPDLRRRRRPFLAQEL